MNAPFLFVPFTITNGTYLPQIRVAWPAASGLAYTYEIYVDGQPTPAATVATNVWVMTPANGLTASSTHSFQVDYITVSGRRSPLSPSASATTWMGYGWGGSIPLEWVASYYGWDSSKWRQPNEPVAPGGPTLLQAFLSGANPLDPTTWLQTHIVNTPLSPYLYWNPRPGLIYQVQSSSNFSTWINVGSPRMAADTMDSIQLQGGSAGYFRVMQLR
jgi:hypothetical protein